MNTFLAASYVERTVRLALGLEPVDGQLGTRIAGPLVVTLDECPRPLDRWRAFPPGVGLDDVLPRMDRHPSGRYLRCYDATTPAAVRVRISDPQRRYVPRRVRVAVPTEAAVIAAELVDADIPVQARSLALQLLPGANADLSAATTAIRGRVVQAGVPLPWCRVQALDTVTGGECGFAHGDDRGEFLLPLHAAPGTVGMPPDVLSVRLTVGVPPVVPPPPDDPLVPVVDALWQLVEEPVALPLPTPVPPDAGTVANGRTFPASYVTSTVAAPVTVPAGQTRSLLVTVP